MLLASPELLRNGPYGAPLYLCMRVSTLLKAAL